MRIFVVLVTYTINHKLTTHLLGLYLKREDAYKAARTHIPNTNGVLTSGVTCQMHEYAIAMTTVRFVEEAHFEGQSLAKIQSLQLLEK